MANNASEQLAADIFLEAFPISSWNTNTDTSLEVVFQGFQQPNKGTDHQIMWDSIGETVHVCFIADQCAHHALFVFLSHFCVEAMAILDDRVSADHIVKTTTIFQTSLGEAN